MDTNILLRIADPSHPHCGIALNAVRQLQNEGDRLVIAPQNLIEAWAVATRPIQRNGLGFSVAEVRRLVDNSERFFELLPDHPDVFARWKDLVETHAVLGLNSHDARLAAFMAVHQVPNILTFNGEDFRRFPGVTVLAPAVVAPPHP